MKVILLEDVGGLGKAGTIKEVRNGYGFNFLLPESLAELATPQTIKQAEKFIAKRRGERESNLTRLQEEARLIEGKQVTIKMKAKQDTLFGSVGREEIAAALAGMDIPLEADAIVIEKAFKTLGVFPVEAHLGHGVKASFSVAIEAE